MTMRVKIVLILLLLVLVGAFLYSDEAQALNTKGFRYYKQKAYREAADYFRQAIEADYLYLYPHYNLACTLSLILQTERLGYFEEQDLLKEIFEQLEITLVLELGYKKKMESDSDLNYARKYFKYYSLLGYSVDKRKDVMVILAGVSYWGLEGVGVLDPVSTIRFNPDNTLEIKNLHWEDNSLEDSSKITSGTYHVVEKEGSILIELHFKEPKNNRNDYPAKLHQDGKLMVPDLRKSESFNDYFVPNYVSLGA